VEISGASYLVSFPYRRLRNHHMHWVAPSSQCVRNHAPYRNMHALRRGAERKSHGVVGAETPQKGAACARRVITGRSSNLFRCPPFFLFLCVIKGGKQGKREKRVDRPALLRLSCLDAPSGEDECLSKDAGTRRSRVVLFVVKLLLEVIEHAQDLWCCRRDLQSHLMCIRNMLRYDRRWFASSHVLNECTCCRAITASRAFPAPSLRIRRFLRPFLPWSSWSVTTPPPQMEGCRKGATGATLLPSYGDWSRK